MNLSLMYHQGYVTLMIILGQKTTHTNVIKTNTKKINYILVLVKIKKIEEKS